MASSAIQCGYAGNAEGLTAQKDAERVKENKTGFKVPAALCSEWMNSKVLKEQKKQNKIKHDLVRGRKTKGRRTRTIASG